MTIEQADRLLRIEAPRLSDLPPGRDELILTALEGVEEMSRLFHFRLSVISPLQTIPPEKLLGESVTFSVRRPGGTRQVFNGIVKSIAAGRLGARGYREYDLEVVPWLWFLTCSTDLRIFQGQTVPEIVQEVFSAFHFTDYDISQILGKYQKREYCVQYRETHFDFLSRLLEEEGILYFFRHEEGAHRLILADHPGAYFDSADAEVEFRANRDVVRHVSEWSPRHEFRTGKWTQRDWNFTVPANVEATAPTRLKVDAFAKYEIYDYPGRFQLRSEGDALTMARMQAHEAEYHVVDGAGDCSGFSPGARFRLTRHDVKGEAGKSYVVTAVRHSARDPTHMAGEGGPAEYSNGFSCIPSDVVCRPASITPKPVVRGPQTAIVVGPAGEEIHTDDFGRVRVQFHWDRVGRKDQKSSCWVRVAQSWAGKQWGTSFIPRVGMEVVVGFLEGDPDRPLVIGAVYNADNMPPYGPDSKTQSGIKTRSSRGGGSADFNELRFEDKKGEEEIYFHAQKNFNRVVENDDTLDVGNNQTNTIQKNRTETIVEGDDKLTIKKGNREILVSLGSSSLEAMQKIEMKVGQSSIVIDQTSITLKAMMIKIEGTATAEMKSTMTTVKGDATLILKGGLTLIN